MTQRLSGKTALVTGGGSGIGKCVCLRLADEGSKVLILDLNECAAEETSLEIISKGGYAKAYACDISSHEQVIDIIDTILVFGDIDLLINSAGIAHIGNIEGTEEADMDRLYNVNVKGIYNTVSAVIKHMKERQSGVIVNLASVAASVAVADRFAYSMTKGAVLSMTYSIAKDYLHDGIRCNCVSPARIHTPFVDDFLKKNYPDNQEEMFDKLSKSQPIGRMGKAEEIAGLIAYLCSDESSFITGSDIPIDGGFITLNS